MLGADKRPEEDKGRTGNRQFLLHRGRRLVDRVVQFIFRVFFWIVCYSQSTLKSPHRSRSKQISESPFLRLSQHCLYLLYRSARAGGGNTRMSRRAINSMGVEITQNVLCIDSTVHLCPHMSH